MRKTCSNENLNLILAIVRVIVIIFIYAPLLSWPCIYNKVDYCFDNGNGSENFDFRSNLNLNNEIMDNLNNIMIDF